MTPSPNGVGSNWTCTSINKVEAARRQIDEAIRLLFENRDPVPIRTLAGAGFRVLNDLCKTSNGSEWMDAVRGLIQPGKHKKFWADFNRPINFLKHADKDPDGSLEAFDETLNDFILLVCCGLYGDLGNPLTLEMRGFHAWYTALHPDVMLKDGPYKEKMRLAFGGLDRMPRTSQLACGKNALDLARKDKT